MVPKSVCVRDEVHANRASRSSTAVFSDGLDLSIMSATASPIARVRADGRRKRRLASEQAGSVGQNAERTSRCRLDRIGWGQAAGRKSARDKEKRVRATGTRTPDLSIMSAAL